MNEDKEDRRFKGYKKRYPRHTEEERAANYAKRHAKAVPGRPYGGHREDSAIGILSFRVTDQEHKALRNWAQAANITLSDLLRALVRSALKQYEERKGTT